MRSHGISGLVALQELRDPSAPLLPYEKASLLTEFAMWVPDESRHLVRLGRLFGVPTLPGLAGALGYSGPLELLSMWLCLFCGNGMVVKDVFAHCRNSDVAVAAACGAQLVLVHVELGRWRV
jgi:hypothetical protein